MLHKPPNNRIGRPREKQTPETKKRGNSRGRSKSKKRKMSTKSKDVCCGVVSRCELCETEQNQRSDRRHSPMPGGVFVAQAEATTQTRHRVRVPPRESRADASALLFVSSFDWHGTARHGTIVATAVATTTHTRW